MVAKMITHAEQAMTRHLQALANEDLDAVVSQFEPESVLQTPCGFYQGADELRRFFARFFDRVPENWFDSFATIRREVVGDTAHIVWKAEPFVVEATQTLICRNGKIVTECCTATLA